MVAGTASFRDAVNNQPLFPYPSFDDAHTIARRKTVGEAHCRRPFE